MEREASVTGSELSFRNDPNVVYFPEQDLIEVEKGRKVVLVNSPPSHNSSFWAPSDQSLTPYTVDSEDSDEVAEAIKDLIILRTEIILPVLMIMKL